MNLILLEPGALRNGRAELTGAQARHAIEVLRVTPGQNLRLGIIDGPRGSGRVTRIGDERVELACSFDAATSEVPDVDLLLALPRPKVMRRLWAQLAAIGVGRIVLTNAARVERNYFDTHMLDPEVYQPLLIEGLQQAQDTRLPRVTIHRRFKPLIEDELDALCPQGTRLVADPAGAGPAVCRRDRHARCSLWARKGAGTSTSCGCWGGAASQPSVSARALCAPTRRVSPCSRPCARSRNRSVFSRP